MNLLTKWAVVAATAMLLAACTAYSAIENGSRQEAGDMSIKVIGKWSAVNMSTVQINGPDAVWTKDGMSLNRLVFFGGLEAGDILLKTGVEDKDDKMPSYRTGMTENGVMEMVESTFARTEGISRSIARDLRPRPFVGRNGFAFEVDLVNKDQIEFTLSVAGATVGNKLYLMYFAAPTLHFFDKDLPTVNAIMDSARLTGGEA